MSISVAKFALILQNFIAEMGCVESKLVATIKYRRVEKDLDKKVAEALKERTKSKKKTFRSVNSITMGLPRFKEGLRNIRDVFDQYGNVSGRNRTYVIAQLMSPFDLDY
jgi:hypothetical protein